jgi:hypothetical protein
MWDFIFGTLWGWWGVAGLTVIGCIVVGYFIPSVRMWAIGVAGVVLSGAAIYTKGNRDRAALEAKRKEEAVAKARKEYDEIDNRPDTPDDVARRLREHGF